MKASKKKKIEQKQPASKINQTWELVDLLAGNKPVGCKWVYIVKNRVDGTLEIQGKIGGKGYS